MNNNRKDTAALLARCKGVFSNAGFLTAGGDSDSPFEDKQGEVRDSYKGKQFLPSGPKSGKSPDSYFGLDDSKKHLYIAEELPFQDREKFQDSQPEKPGKGFLTSDYNKRGEFTNTVRTEQYRELLKQEDRIVKQRPAVLSVSVQSTSSRPPSQQEEFLYDQVFDRTQPSRAAQKLSRDTSNPTMLGRERKLGVCKTTYRLQFESPQSPALPKFGRTAVIRDTFYEKDMSKLNTS